MFLVVLLVYRFCEGGGDDFGSGLDSKIGPRVEQVFLLRLLMLKTRKSGAVLQYHTAFLNTYQ